MNFRRASCRLAGAMVLVAFIGSVAQAQTTREQTESVVRDYLASHPEEIQRIVKDYLIGNPDVIQQVILEIIKKRQPNLAAGTGAKPQRPDKSAEIKANAQLLFDSPRQVALGNPKGDVTLVEFFDYNCGYCKRALGDTQMLLKSDPKLRIVLKELPILGPGSVEAARVAVAVRMQDQSGAKYLAFHEKMLADRVPADKAQAMAHAAAAGADMARLEQDLGSSEVERTIQESVSLAQALGINGTPGYVLNEEIIPGAIGAAALKDRIAAARSRAPG
jgi:protein-disulfide isomerase